MSTSIADFRARLDITAVADKLGLELTNVAGGAKVVCPVHAEDSPSCYLYVSDNHFHCFGCSAHGSVFDLVTAVQGSTFGEALEWLATTFGLEAPARDPRAAARAAALRALRERCAEGIGEGLLGFDPARAAELGLGRATGLAELAAEFRALPLSTAEVRAFEGQITVELAARGGVVAIGALVGGPDGLELRRPSWLRFPAFAFLSAARSAIGENSMIVHARRIDDALAAQRGGALGTVSAGVGLDPESAAELASLAPRVIIAVRAGDVRRDILDDLRLVIGAGAFGAVTAVRDDSLSAAVPTDRYLSALLARDPSLAGELSLVTGAAPSASTRELYRSAIGLPA